MAPNQNNEIFDNQPSIDQQTSLSSQKIKNKINDDYLQLYDFKMEPTSQGSKGYKGNGVIRFLLIALLLISLMIVYSLVGHPTGWRKKIEQRNEAVSMIGRLPRKGQSHRIQQKKIEQPKQGMSNEQGRNPNKDGKILNGQALLSTIKQLDNNINTKFTERPVQNILQRRNSQEQVQILPKAYLPNNNQIQTNNIPSNQLQKLSNQNNPIYQIVKTSQSFTEYREKPNVVIGSDQYTPIKVQPIIHPFNPQPQTSSSSFQFIGNEAGISTQMLYLARERKKVVNYELNNNDRITKQQIEYYEARYNVGKYEELPFCIVVPSFNNIAGDRYKKNIQSIIMQNYTNFHIVIIDDASTDATGISIKNHLLLSKFNPQKYLIKTNKQQQNAMPNLRSAALQNCKDQQIFLVVDGDDELLGRQVLKVFNAAFQEKGLWFVYSNFLMGTGQLGYSRPFPKEVIRQNFYRSSAFVSSHLRAFYTRLFKNVEEKDLRDQYGRYFKAANDVAICFPILQQAHTKVGYLPQMTYFYNADTGINNHFIRLDEQKANQMSVRNRKHYEPLEKLF